MKINIKHLRTKASLLQETGENFRPHLYNNNMLALIHTCTHKKRIKQKLVLLLPPLSEKEFEPIFSFLNNHETESSIQENILII